MGISIVVNGQQVHVRAGTTIADLVASLGVAGPVAVECNREVIPRARHPMHILSAGDRVELVTFVGGG